MTDPHPAAAPDAGAPQESAERIGGGLRPSYEDDSIREWKCGCYEDQGGYHFCAKRHEPLTVLARTEPINLREHLRRQAAEWGNISDAPGDVFDVLRQLLVEAANALDGVTAPAAHQERTEPTKIVQRLTEWLSKGGFFNPAEMAGANEDATRQLILDARTALGHQERIEYENKTPPSDALALAADDSARDVADRLADAEPTPAANRDHAAPMDRVGAPARAAEWQPLTTKGTDEGE